MDPLEILVRDTLREHAGEAPDMSVLVPRHRHRLVPLAVAASAAAVAAVVALVLALGPDRGAHRTPAATSRPDTAAAPAGYVWASYHGVEVAVPESARWFYVSCSRPNTDWVQFVIPDVAVSCPATLAAQPADPAAVQVAIAPLSDRSVGGPPFPLTGGGSRVLQTRTVADPGVVVHVSAPTQAQVDLIIGSIRRTPVDHLGCADRLLSTTPTNPPAPSLVPSGVRSAVVCSYATMGADHRYWLVASHRLGGTDATELAVRFDALSGAFRPSTGTFPPPVDWVVFDYGTATRTVAIERWAYPASVTDGRRTVAADSAAADPPLPAI